MTFVCEYFEFMPANWHLEAVLEDTIFLCFFNTFNQISLKVKITSLLFYDFIIKLGFGLTAPIPGIVVSVQIFESRAAAP